MGLGRTIHYVCDRVRAFVRRMNKFAAEAVLGRLGVGLDIGLHPVDARELEILIGQLVTVSPRIAIPAPLAINEVDDSVQRTSWTLLFLSWQSAIGCLYHQSLRKQRRIRSGVSYVGMKCVSPPSLFLSDFYFALFFFFLINSLLGH